MKRKTGISPFLASVMLIVITLVIGGTLYTQYRQMVVSQIKNPSLLIQDINVAPDGQTVTLSVKNNGNVQIALQGFSVSFGSNANLFQFVSKNATIISSSSGTSTLQPGDILTTGFKTKFSLPTFATFTLTVIGDQMARAFNVQA